eukprot:m.28472 g.28472  ORF g.28472 m.28472 type:complete len:278 (+) comp11844_c0_seq2:220-1053(+)
MAVFLDDVFTGDSYASPSPLLAASFMTDTPVDFEVDWRDDCLTNVQGTNTTTHPLSECEAQSQGLFDDLQALAESLDMEEALSLIQPTSSKRQQSSIVDALSSAPLQISSSTMACPSPKRAKASPDSDAASSPTSITFSDTIASSHSDASDDEHEVDRIVCPVCGGAGRNSDRRICGTCYSGLWNDCAKAIRGEMVPELAGPQDAKIAVIRESLINLPRGCQKEYHCGKDAFRHSMNSQKKCTRCRSLFTLNFVPELAITMVNNCRARLLAKKAKKP